METSPCRGCQKPIVWAEDEKGQKIPLDPRPAVYAVKVLSNGKVACYRDKDFMVSHFVTCPERDKFSGGKDRENRNDDEGVREADDRHDAGLREGDPRGDQES